MSNFTGMLNAIEVASSKCGVMTTDQFKNIALRELLRELKSPAIGEKDGSHFVRTSFKMNNGVCLSRCDTNTENAANLVIIDCDKRMDENGEEIIGAPDPAQVHHILCVNNVTHVLYGSYSHYVSNVGSRYRIIIPTIVSYNKQQLAPTVESIIGLINKSLPGDLLANAKENCTWAQPWYLPRKPADSLIPDLYLEYLDGNAIDVIDAAEIPPITQIKIRSDNSREGAVLPITAFNQQYPIQDLLKRYGYKLCCRSGEYEKWLSPNSTSRKAGITVRDNKIFSHHNDALNDGWWHDAFDLMRTHERFNLNDAIIYAAKNTIAADGNTVEEYNKSIAKKTNKGSTAHNVNLQSIILGRLLQKITSVNFQKEADLDDDKKPTKQQLHVIVISKILECARKYNWGLCRNYDFIYVYNSEYWQLIDEDIIKTFLGEAAVRMGIDPLSALHFKFKEDLLKQFLSSAHLPKPERSKDTVLINLKNGTFEITPEGVKLRPFNPSDFLTYQLPFEYDATADAPLFKKYLDRVLPDKILQNILSEYLGYVFTPNLKLEQALLLYGSGANGKSVFYEIIRRLLGEQNISEYSLQSLTDGYGYHRAMIGKKLLNYASEINGKLEAAIFKQLVSGEPVEARLPYGNPHIISDYAKLMFNCNELPMNVEHTEAFFRRFLIIPFNVTIPESERDPQLAKKIIENELSGVFNWVLEGLKRLLAQNNFTQSNIVGQTREQYRKDSDSVALFLEETGYQSDVNNWIALKTVFNEYKEYCRDYGYRCVSYKSFQKRMEKLRILLDKKNCGLVAFINKATENV